MMRGSFYVLPSRNASYLRDVSKSLPSTVPTSRITGVNEIHTVKFVHIICEVHRINMIRPFLTAKYFREIFLQIFADKFFFAAPTHDLGNMESVLRFRNIFSGFYGGI